MTSIRPTVALGAMLRDSEGLRKSQSTSITRPRPPACAMTCATATEMVDFPSFGNDDVNPIILLDPPATFKSIASLIERIDSAKDDKGLSTTFQDTLDSHVIVLGPSPTSRGV